MAKGNDGNYLQHGVEVSAARRLSSLEPDGRLHIAFGHGMAPFEPCDRPKNPPAQSFFMRALNQSFRAEGPDESPLVTAYRKTCASLAAYPNSAELLRSAIGAERLSGGIAEIDPEKHSSLQQAWAGTKVSPVKGSWRNELGASGVLACPPDLQTPWLFTLDPMTFSQGPYADDDFLYDADLGLLTSALRGYVASGRPGLAALFVYSVRPDSRAPFWRFVEQLAGETDTELTSCWLTHRGGNRNLAGLLYSHFEPEDVPSGAISGRE